MNSTDGFLTGGGTALLDLSGLDTSPQSPPSFPEFPTPTDSLNPPSQDMGISLLDDELMSLGNKTRQTAHICSIQLKSQSPEWKLREINFCS